MQVKNKQKAKTYVAKKSANQAKSLKVDKQKRSKKVRKFSMFHIKKIRNQTNREHTNKISGSFRLFVDSLSLLRQHWKLFGGIVLVYFIMTVLLVGALSGNVSFNELRKPFIDEFGRLAASVALFGILLSSSNSATETTAVFQTLLILVFSLATIWSLRQVLAGNKIQIRDAFYKGMYPVVPMILVLLFLSLLLLPLLAAGFIFNLMFTGGLAVLVIEKILWGLMVFLLIIMSIYLITSRIFAIYIVALPDMRPIMAIKKSRQLVVNRQWSIIRKLLFLPFALLIIGGIIIIPLIIFVPAIVSWIFLTMSLFGLVFVHTYIYSLYKELL